MSEQEQQNQEQPQQMTFPRTDFNVQPNVMIITTMLAPDLHIVKYVGAQHMDQLEQLLREARKQRKQELQVIQDINSGKVRDIRQLLVKP